MNVDNVVIIKYLSQNDPRLREVIRSVGDFSIKIRKDTLLKEKLSNYEKNKTVQTHTLSKSVSKILRYTSDGKPVINQ